MQATATRLLSLSIPSTLKFLKRVAISSNYHLLNNNQWKHYFSTQTSERKELPNEFLESISSIKEGGGVEISTNTYELTRHGKGESYHAPVPPSAILYPKSTQAVSEIIKQCARYRIPIIPFGTGTSLEGHVSALHGGVSLDMNHFNDINIDEVVGDGDLENFFVTVGAGVTRNTLNEALRHTGLQFSVDPGADASIGGMIACGASGTSAVKYGTMKDNILALEAVLPDGTIINCGTKALKSSAGYDLTRLLCGSEGTLAVITHATVKLHPIPSYISAAVCSFPTLHLAAEAVAMIRQLDIPVDRCELLDTTSIDAFNRFSSDIEDMPLKPHLFLEFSGASETSLNEQTEFVQSLCMEDFSAADFNLTSNDEQRRHLWSARHQLYYASIALRPGSEKAFLTDACVPLSKFADLIQDTVDTVAKLNVVGPCFGHAGDGNFHCILPLLPDESPEYMDRVMQVNDRLIEQTIKVGGTCTGEHGVGFGKMKYLPLQYGHGAVHMMKLIKQAVDPLNIMNPGKIVSLDDENY